jgi:hypothetical protein
MLAIVTGMDELQLMYNRHRKVITLGIQLVKSHSLKLWQLRHSRLRVGDYSLIDRRIDTHILELKASYSHRYRLTY